MSRPLDYSRFDRLDLSDGEDDEPRAAAGAPLAEGLALDAALDEGDFGGVRAAAEVRACARAARGGGLWAQLTRPSRPGKAALASGAGEAAVRAALEAAPTPEEALRRLEEAAGRGAAGSGGALGGYEAQQRELARMAQELAAAAEAQAAAREGGEGGGSGAPSPPGGPPAAHAQPATQPLRREKEAFAGGGGKGSKAAKAKALDPSALPRWPQGQSVHPEWGTMSFTVQEKLQSLAGFFGDGPEADLRQSLLIIAQCYSGHGEDKGGMRTEDTVARPKERNTAFSLQDKAQSQGVILEVIGARRCEDGAPLLEVLFTVNKRSDMEDARTQARLKGMFQRMHAESPAYMRNIHATVEEQDLLVAMLERHGRALPAACAEAMLRGKEQGLRASYLVPPRAAGHIKSAPNAKETRVCVCGEPAAKCCSRCTKKWYCSAACQRGDWKQHKKVCVDPNASSSKAEYVSVSMTAKGSLASRGAMGEVSSIVSMQGAGTVTTEAGRALNQKKGRRAGFVVKLQAPPVRGGAIMCYDQARKLTVMIEPAHTGQQGYNRLFDLVRKDRTMQVRAIARQAAAAAAFRARVASPSVPPPWAARQKPRRPRCP